MTSVLIVGDDPELRATLARDLTAHSFEVRTAGSLDHALTMLTEQSVDVLLAELRIHSDGDGLELLRRVHESSSLTRAVMMSGAASAQDYQAATQLGAVRVLWKPFSNADLLSAIQEALESRTGFRGNIHGLSLIDLLQMMHFARRSVTVGIRGPTSGNIHMQDGEIIDAESASLGGEEALQSLLSSPSGAIHTSVLGKRARTIRREFEPLLLDVLRQIDEKHESEPESGFDFAFPVSSRRPSLGLTPQASATQAAATQAAVTQAVELSQSGVPSTVKRLAALIPQPPRTERTPNLTITAPNPIVKDLPVTPRTPAVAPAPPPSAPRQSAPPSENTRQRKIDQACRDVVNKVQGASACGVVDLENGVLLGAHSETGLSEELEMVLARAAVDLFRGPSVTQSERMMRAHRGVPEDGQHYFHEIHISSTHNYHFAKTIKQGRAVIMLVTKKTTNVGMGWAMLRSVIPLVEPNVP